VYSLWCFSVFSVLCLLFQPCMGPTRVNSVSCRCGASPVLLVGLPEFSLCRPWAFQGLCCVGQGESGLPRVQSFTMGP
jgi:hypothetical protein